MLKKILLLIGLFTLLGCSSGSRKNTERLRHLIKEGNFSGAEDYVSKDSFIRSKESRLLRVLEQALVHYLNGHYYQALLKFDKAKELSDRLFTVSISKKIKSSIANDNYDNYYGEKYERSMIRFYQSLMHMKIYMTGLYESYRSKVGKEIKDIPEKKLSLKERKFHLQAARSILLEWNSLLENYKESTRGVIIYKDDLLAKIYGAFVHEQFHSRSDDRIALSLYKEAKNVLFKNYNILETYNKKAEKFKNNFKKLHKYSQNKVKTQYIQKTEISTNFLSYIDEKIKKLKSRKRDNVFIILGDGLIEEKNISKIDIPLPMATMSIVSGNDVLSFSAFCASLLSLPSENNLKIYFEVPTVSYRPISSHYKLLIRDESGRDVKTLSTVVANPLSDIAYLTNAEKKGTLYFKTGMRVAVKQLAALAASYALYKTQAKKSEILALTLASFSFTAASKIIEESERADLRYWSSLPHNFQVQSLNLPKGKYHIFSIKEGSNGDLKERKIQSFEVQSEKSSVLVSKRMI